MRMTAIGIVEMRVGSPIIPWAGFLRKVQSAEVLSHEAIQSNHVSF